jgi:pterin-4a-carbinolamine dehydratase
VRRQKQQGLTVSGLLLVSAVLIAVLVTGFKLFPAYNEYLKVKKAISDISHNPESRGSINEVRVAFDRRAAIDDIKVITGHDLEVARRGDGVAVSARWSAKVPLFYNVSACMDFEAQSE